MVVPVPQLTSMNNLADKAKKMEQKGMSMTKTPKFSDKIGKNKQFYGVDLGIGAVHWGGC